jgi:DNA-binding response OmpR family regulator
VSREPRLALTPAPISIVNETTPNQSSNAAEPAGQILVLEPDLDLAEKIRNALNEAAPLAEVDVAPTLESAQGLILSAKPDLFVLDLMIPGISGLDVLAQLRADEDGEKLPVVVISAWSDARDEAFAAGADRFVLKPFIPDDLRAVVEELVT